MNEELSASEVKKWLKSWFIHKGPPDVSYLYESERFTATLNEKSAISRQLHIAQKNIY